jgi:hypothetical protein
MTDSVIDCRPEYTILPAAHIDVFTSRRSGDTTGCPGVFNLVDSFKPVLLG